jgi:hypothetical protein
VPVSPTIRSVHEARVPSNNAAGLKLLRQTEGKIEERGVSDAEGIYKVAQAYAILGDKVSALHMLQQSIGGGFFPLSLLRARSFATKSPR